MIPFFETKVSDYEQQSLSTQSAANRTALLRGVTFILLGLTIYVLFKAESWWWLVPVLASGFGFYFLVIKHRGLLNRKQYFDHLTKVNADEINRLNLNLDAFNEGSIYMDENHRYAKDLDIFGKSSLFQLLNRCELKDSEDLLATWLTEKSSAETIMDRQASVKELSEKNEWFQNLRATTRLTAEKRKKSSPHIKIDLVKQWVKKSSPNLNALIIRSASILLAALFLLCIGFIIGGTTYHIIYIPLIVNGLFIGYIIRKLNIVTKGLNGSYHLIAAYADAINEIEQSTFKSPGLNTLKNRLQTNKQSASAGIEKLSKLVLMLDSRSNAFYFILDLIFIMDAHLLIRLLNWKKSYSEHVMDWFAVVNEVEAISSLAGFAHANPEYAYPTISKTEFLFEAKQLGHPLIPAKDQVCNDYKINGSGHIDLITGSNMSGKSTFERTVGINMVLAQIGAPVNSQKLEMGITSIFTSMRTTDNLSESVSSFYAELKRIKKLLEEVEHHPSTFFLLDEILKGTNSEDRHKGAIALIKKLSTKSCFGMISTHDLALSKLERDDSKIRNLSFNSIIKGDEIIFDYKLTPGPCNSFNASKLMEQMGIM